MRGRRVDANQAELVAAWRAAGATWIDLTDSEDAGFDGLVLFDGQTYIVEIKDGSKTPSDRRLTDKEQARRAEVEDADVFYNVVETMAAALRLIGRGQ